MKPATVPPARRDGVRLLVVDPAADTAVPACFADLPALLRCGDLLVVNDAATLPASLAGRTAAGEAVEVRLLGPARPGTWRAVLFGAGDWRTPTEQRPPPPRVAAGEAITIAVPRNGLSDALSARITAVSVLSARLVDLAFDRDGAELWSALYAAGAPVQYAYVAAPLALWSVQTVYAARPWAAEMPSAGRPLTWEILAALRRRGVRLAQLTHAAGLSSTGDAVLDAALPLPERYDIPAATVAAIADASGAAGRVIAVGTTVVRALEGCVAAHGRLVAGSGETDLVVAPGFDLRVVDALLSGIHDPAESHWHILSAFAGHDLLTRAAALAEALGFRCHELGDSTLILPGATCALRQAA